MKEWSAEINGEKVDFVFHDNREFVDYEAYKRAIEKPTELEQAWEKEYRKGDKRKSELEKVLEESELCECGHSASLHNNAAHCLGENCSCKAFN